MGNQASSVENKSRDEKINKKSKVVYTDKTKEDIIFSKDNFSSYKGMKTDEMTDNQKSINDKSISNDTTSVVTNYEKNETQEIKIPTLFEWKDGGNLVYVTGNFSNWTQWFAMTKNPLNGNFELMLDLPRGIYQYKYVVDNKWVFSKYQNTCYDEKGNINNIVDNSNISKLVKEKESKLDYDYDQSAVRELKKNLTDLYNDYYPTKNEMNVDAPIVPHHYNSTFYLNNSITNESPKAKNFYFESVTKVNFNENNSYKSIPITPHVNL